MVGPVGALPGVAFLARAALVALVAVVPIHAQRDPTHVNVLVRVAAPLGIIPSTAVGLNTSAYDANLLDSGVPRLLRAAGITVLRYPGATEADVYQWQTNTVTPGQYRRTNPRDTFDTFMGLAAHSGAQAMITVNYGTNATGTGGDDPQEAAAWVRFANVIRRYGVKYWEIGNEVYGNGTYGASWEPDLHPAHGPVAYGRHAVEFSNAMKAADPTIDVGVALTAPGNWPDADWGVTPDWNRNVLTTACSAIDFVAVHWYPESPASETDAHLLQSPQSGLADHTPAIPAMVARLRTEIARYCPSRAGRLQIMVTETNSVSSRPGKQTVSLVTALFLADSYMTWLEQGVTNVDWWQLHNDLVLGTNDSSLLYGAATYGDYGILANGRPPEPAVDTPFPSYYGLLMLRVLGTVGDEMVTAGSDDPLVAVHAVKRTDGSLAVLLINKDPGASRQVTLSLPGYNPSPSATIATYGVGSTAISTAVDRGLTGTPTLTITPYSLTTIIFTPAARRP